VRGESIERVVLVFPGALGDLLLALPALRALRARHAGARVTAVVNQPLRALVELAGVADETAALEGADAALLFGGERLPRWLGGRPFVYGWLGGGDDEVRARVAAAARGARFFGVERGGSATHAAVAYARAVGAPTAADALAAAARLVPPPSSAADARWAGLTAPILAVHPGAGGRAKRWDIAGFVQVAVDSRAVLAAERVEHVIDRRPSSFSDVDVVVTVVVRVRPLQSRDRAKRFELVTC